MSQYLPPKYYSALANEIRLWEQEAIVTGDVAQILIARYPVQPAQKNIVAIVTILGAVLVGLGTLLFIGANWNYMSAFWRLLLIFLAVILSHYAGWKWRFEPGTRPRLGTAMLLLGSLFYGGGIWLIAQMFNVDINFPNGLLMWSIGALATAFATGVAPLAILTNLLLGAWMLANDGGIFQAVIGSAAAIGLSYKLRSPWAAVVAITSTSLWVVSRSHTGECGLVAWGACLFAAYLWHRERWRLFEKSFMYVGAISMLIGCLISTSNHYFQLDADGWKNLALIFAVAISCGAFVVSRVRTVEREIAGCLIGALGVLAASALPEYGRLVTANIILVAALVGLAWTAINRLQSVALFNLSIVFFVLDIIARYFDFFFSMMNRSMFFIAGGVVLMVAGAAAEKSRRKLLEGMQS